MNEEIKEILEQLEWYRKIGKKDVYYPEYVLSNKKAFILLDYITNLQQEIEKLNDDKRGMLVQLYKANDDRDNLQQENERLKEKIKRIAMIGAHTSQDNVIIHNVYDDYKSRCEKAIEYIKDNITWYYDEDLDESVYQDEVSGDKILNILQNGSDEE